MFKSAAEQHLENKSLERIFKHADILSQIHKRDQDIREFANYVQEVAPGMKEKLACLNQQTTKKVIDNITIELVEQGQKLFQKGEMAEYAYIVLHGELSFYSDNLRSEGGETPEASSSVQPTDRRAEALEKAQRIKLLLKQHLKSMYQAQLEQQAEQRARKKAGLRKTQTTVW